MSEKRISIVVGEETWRAARLRAVAEGMTFQDLGAEWFAAYAGGSRGLAAGEPKENGPLVQAVVDAAGPTTPSPAARPCSQAFKHHINHTGRPCKECGYPVKEAV